MIKSILFLAFLGSSLLASSPKVYSYYSQTNKSFVPIKIAIYKGISLSDACFKKKSVSCEAWSAALRKAKYPERRAIASAGNPAAIYCAAYNSKNVIFLDEKGREFDYCFFSDGSAIDAWDLYNKHNK